MPAAQSQWLEGRLQFMFPVASASSYDRWSFYRNQFHNCCSRDNKAVDLIYLDGRIAWLIEVKDYSAHARTKVIDLADEIAQKVRDSLAGLVAAGVNANDQEERDYARRFLSARQVRVVCHLEQPAKQSRLRPRAIETDKLKMKLQSVLKAIDPHPAVVDREHLSNGMNWRVVQADVLPQSGMVNAKPDSET